MHNINCFLTFVFKEENVNPLKLRMPRATELISQKMFGMAQIQGDRGFQMSGATLFPGSPEPG